MSLIDRLRRIFNLKNPVFARAPYPVSLYESILVSLLQVGMTRVVFDWKMPEESFAGAPRLLALRHDLDHKLLYLERLTQIEERLGLRSSIYVRLDNEAYDSATAVNMLKALKARGHSVGLHTSVYAADDPWTALHAELKQFHHLFGFPPDAATTHGFSSESNVVLRRRSFLEAIRRDKTITNCIWPDHCHLGRYDALVGDASRLPGSNQRCIDRNGIRDATRKKRRRLLLLTHPEYWDGHDA